MLLVSGAVALSRKLVDEKAKRQEAKQGNLSVGDSDVAKRAFASQTSINPSEPGPVKRAPTVIKYEDPNEVTAISPDATSPGITSPRPEFKDARHSSRVSVASPVQSERGTQEPWSPDSNGASTPSDQQSLQPPPYSSRAVSSSNTLRPSLHSNDTDVASMASVDTSSATVRSTNSNGTHALRIKTIGSDLKSGFPYHDALFEMNVHPQKWTAFTTQVIDGAKLSASDQAATWASATAVALTGAIGTSVMLGRSMNRTAQEKKIKAGLASAESKLGETLKLWNEEYFRPRGIFVHLELSESAMKNPGQQSKALRKGVLLYSKQEDRQRKREERKFVIVVTKLDDEGEPTEALRELEIEEKRNEAQGFETVPAVVEIGSSDTPLGVSELPTDQINLPTELPADTSTPPKAYEPPNGYVEMSSDNSLLLEKMHINDGQDAHQHDSYHSGHPPVQRAEESGSMSAQQEKMHLEASQQAPVMYHNNNFAVVYPQSYTTERSSLSQEQTRLYNDQGPSSYQDQSFDVTRAEPEPDGRHSPQVEKSKLVAGNPYAPQASLSAHRATTLADKAQSPLTASERNGLTSSPSEKSETNPVNPYTLEFNPAPEREEHHETTSRTIHDDIVPRPLNVKEPSGVALYDGADWGGDDDLV